MARNGRIVGLDISKAKADGCIRSLQLRRSEPSTPEGQAAMVAWLRANEVTTAVMEASGAYERPWAQALREAGIKVRVVDPKRVRHFARSAGQLAKNDPIDAEMIAWFGETFDDDVGLPHDPAREEIDVLVTARTGLRDMLIQIGNLDEHRQPRVVVKAQAAIAKTMRAQIAKLDAVIATKIKAKPVLPFPRTNREFLKAIFGADWERAHVTGFPGDPNAPPPGAWAGGPAKTFPLNEDENTYFCVSLFRRGQRQAQFLERWVVLGVDDVGPKVAPADVLKLLGRPTYVIETSPRNEQWGYVLDDANPIVNAIWANDFIKAIIRKLVGVDGRDPGMRDVTRYLRLPYGRNHKEPYAPAGFTVRGSAWR